MRACSAFSSACACCRLRSSCSSCLLRRWLCCRSLHGKDSHSLHASHCRGCRDQCMSSQHVHRHPVLALHGNTTARSKTLPIALFQVSSLGLQTPQHVALLLCQWLVSECRCCNVPAGEVWEAMGGFDGLAVPPAQLLPCILTCMKYSFTSLDH